MSHGPPSLVDLGILPLPGAVPGAAFTLSKSVTLTEEYTDNFNLFQSQVGPRSPGPSQAGGKVSNFRTTLSGGLTLAIDTAKTQGFVSAGLSLAHDTAREGLQVALFPTVSLGISHEFNPRLSLTIIDRFRRNDDTFEGDAFGLRRERSVFTANSFTVALDWLIDRIATQYYYRNSVFFSERPESETDATSTTTISHVLGARASVPIGVRMTGSAGYEFSLTDSTDQPERIGNLVYGQVSRAVGQFATVGLAGSTRVLSPRTTTIWSISAFSSYGWPTGLSVSGSVGYSYLTGSGLATDRSTITTQTQAAYTFVNGLALTAGFFSGFRQTFLEGEDFGLVITRSYFGSASYPLARSISARVSASYNQNELTGVGNVPTDRSLDSLSVTARVSWQALSWLSASAGYRYGRYTGGRLALEDDLGVVDVGGGPITENRVFVSLSAWF